jgi:hypothetical protein
MARARDEQCGAEEVHKEEAASAASGNDEVLEAER